MARWNTGVAEDTGKKGEKDCDRLGRRLKVKNQETGRSTRLKRESVTSESMWTDWLSWVCLRVATQCWLVAAALVRSDVIMMSVRITPLILKFRMAVCYIPSTSYFSVIVRNISSLFLMEEWHIWQEVVNSRFWQSCWAHFQPKA